MKGPRSARGAAFFMTRANREYPWKSLAAGLLLSLGLTLLFRSSFLDIRLSQWAYGLILHQPWGLGQAQPWKALYQYGPALAMLPGFFALGILIAGFFKPSLAVWRGPSLYLVLCLGLGPGLLVNGLGKGLMGRPRPEDVDLFGGAWQYQYPFTLGIPGRGKSFLSGHASAGYFLMAGFFILPKAWRILSLAGGIIMGLGLAFARLLQGGHFASDGLLCGSLLFTLFALLSPIAYKPWNRLPGRAQRGSVLVVAGGIIALLSLLGLAVPVYEEQNHLWLAEGHLRQAGKTVERIHALPQRSTNFLLQADKGDIEVTFDPSLEGPVVEAVAQGFGVPGSKWIMKDVSSYMQSQYYGLLLQKKGFFMHGKARFQVRLPAPQKGLFSYTLTTREGQIRLSTRGCHNPLQLEGSAIPGLATPKDWMREGTGFLMRPGWDATLVLNLEGTSLILE
jgi:lipid A 4'-phosphatase